MVIRVFVASSSGSVAVSGKGRQGGWGARKSQRLGEGAAEFIAFASWLFFFPPSGALRYVGPDYNSHHA